MVRIIGFSPATGTPSRKGWSNQDLAELYRVEGALLQAGLRIETEVGVSDEGDPWFVFCHGDSGELIVHFARIDGRYMVAAPALPKPLKGADLGSIVRRFIAENPVSLPVPEANRQSNVLFHPAALLTIFVATILIMSSPGEGLAAGDDQAGGEETAPPEAPHSLPGGPAEAGDKHRAAESAMLLIAIAIATEMAHQQEGENMENAAASSGRIAAFLTHSSGQEGEAGADAHDLLGLSDAYFVSEHKTDDSLASTAEPEDETVLPDSPALKIRADSGRDPQIALPSPDEEIPPAPAERATTEPVAEARLEPAVQDQSQTAPAEQPGQEPPRVASPPEPMETARNWIEEKTRAEDIDIKVLSAEQALDFPDIVDMDVLVEAEDTGAATAVPASRPAFDAAARQAVLYFLSSDDDIAIIGDGRGSIVVFDQSDLASGAPLTFMTWTFEETTISIVGHSDTVADALALVA